MLAIALDLNMEYLNCDCWSNYEKRPGRVYSTTCELWLQLDGASVLCLFFKIYINTMSYQYIYSLGCYQIRLLMFTYWYCTLIYNKSSSHYDLFIITTKLCSSKKFQINTLWYFWTQSFATEKYIYNLPKALITGT